MLHFPETPLANEGVEEGSEHADLKTGQTIAKATPQHVELDKP